MYSKITRKITLQAYHIDYSHTFDIFTVDRELEVSEKLLEQELCEQKQASEEMVTCPSSTIQGREDREAGNQAG